MRLLNNLKHKMSLSRDTLIYINRYHRIYKQVISDANKRHNDKQIVRATNPTEMMWQLINKRMGNSRKLYQEIWL
jgi:malate/lactate dehydrogenase